MIEVLDPLHLADLTKLFLMVQALTEWKGSLEVANVTLLVQPHRCPV